MVGRFSLALAICSPIFLFTNLKLRDIQAADAQNKFSFAEYVRLRFLTTLLAFIIIAFIVFIVDYPHQTAQVILIMGVAKSVESFSDVIYGLLQKHEQMARIARSMIAKGVLSFLFLTAAIYITDNLFWGVGALAAMWLAVLLGYDLPQGLKLLTQTGHEPVSLRAQIRFAAQNKAGAAAPKLMRLAWLAFPLGAATALTSLYVNIPNYLIERYLSAEALGIFAALAYPIVAGNVVVNALAQVALPRLSKYFADNDRSNFNALLLKLVGIGILLGAAGIVIALVGGHAILALLYNQTYAAYAHIFVWLMAAAGINYAGWFLSGALTATGIFRQQLTLRIVSVLVIVLLSLFLIPEYGLLGAAWVTCLSAAVTLILFAALMIGLSRTGKLYDVSRGRG